MKLVQRCAIAWIFIWTACQSSEEKISPQTENKGRFLYVLNEGLFQHNNATLTRYNLDNKIVEKDFFGKVNQQRLGDTGNDIGVYGSKLYILVTVSSQIFVTERFSAKLIRRIPILNERKLAREPRQMVFHEGKVYVSCFDGNVIVLDTASLEIVQTVYSGRNPEGIAIQNQKLYVANSGGKDFPNYDSTLTIFELPTLKLVKKITIGINPTQIVSTNQIPNRIFICLKGNYSEILQRWIALNTLADTVLFFSLQDDLQYLAVDNELWGIKQEHKNIIVKRYNPLSGDLISSFSPFVEVQTLYGLDYIKEIKSLVFSDARSFVNTGVVYLCTQTGEITHSFAAELNPAHYAFINF
ncbi:MAG: hypothetical protein NZM38_01130 [Cytophagales bacterium]|nr:hypothetical protein [Cytophagales bacterium]MDW8383352.1 hypothetical protein [Flammeovirgaceae bacterium]